MIKELIKSNYINKNHNYFHLKYSKIPSGKINSITLYFYRKTIKIFVIFLFKPNSNQIFNKIRKYLNALILIKNNSFL